MRSVVRSFSKIRYIPIPAPIPPGFRVGSVLHCLFLDGNRLVHKDCELRNRPTHGLCLAIGPARRASIPFRHGDVVDMRLADSDLSIVVVARPMESKNV